MDILDNNTTQLINYLQNDPIASKVVVGLTVTFFLSLFKGVRNFLFM